MRFNKHGIATTFKFNSLYDRNMYLNSIQITTNKHWSKRLKEYEMQ